MKRQEHGELGSETYSTERKYPDLGKSRVYSIVSIIEQFDNSEL